MNEKVRKAAVWYLDCILAAGAASPLDQGVSCVDDSTDPVCVGVQLCFKCLMFLMFALKTNQESHQNQV